MLEHLRNPEYLHVLLHGFPIYGTAIGAFGLVIALASRSRAARVIALAMIALSTLSAWPVYHYGEAAYDRVLTMADNDGRKWLDEHQRRGEQLIYVFYAAAAVAVGAIAAERFAPRAALPLGIIVALLAIGGAATGSYIATAGGRIRHREFRYVLPPSTDKDHDE